MKLLIINQFFYPDIAATAQLLTDLTEDLAKKDLEITVLTSNSNYLGGKLDAKNNGSHVGAKVFRVNSFSFGKKWIIGRILDYLSFYCLIAVRSLLLPKQDVVLVLTTPPLIALIGLILKKAKRSKYVCLVEDLYPDTAIKLGFLKEKRLSVKMIKLISDIVYRHSDLIIAISRKMKMKLIERGIAESKIRVIDNWADRRQIYPIARQGNWFIHKYQLHDYFTIQYSGNMGLAHDFNTFLNGIEKLQSYQDIKFLFIGDGNRKAEILTYKNRQKLDNLLCLPYQERKNLAYSISAGDVSLISLKSRLDGFIVPCKLYGIMAAARPIIFVGNYDNDVARVIRDCNCGFQIDERDVEDFVEKVLLLYKDRKLVEFLGNNGYRYFLHHFERKKATSKYYESLKEIV